MHGACLNEEPADVFRLCGAGRPCPRRTSSASFSWDLFFLGATCGAHEEPLPAGPRLHFPIPHALLCSCGKEANPQLLRLLCSPIHPHAGSARRFGAENQCFGACFCHPPLRPPMPGRLQLSPFHTHGPDVLSAGSKSREKTCSNISFSFKELSLLLSWCLT